MFGRLQIVTIDTKPTYGANCVDSVRIHFSLLQDPLPKDSKCVMVAIYRCNGVGSSAYESGKKKVENAKFSNIITDDSKSSEDLG